MPKPTEHRDDRPPLASDDISGRLTRIETDLRKLLVYAEAHVVIPGSSPAIPALPRTGLLGNLIGRIALKSGVPIAHVRLIIVVALVVLGITPFISACVALEIR